MMSQTVVETRNVDALVHALGGSRIDKSGVSRMCEELDQEAEAFRSRPLDDEVVYVWLDTLYERVRSESHHLTRRRRASGGEREEKGGGDFLEKRGNVWNERGSFTLSSNRTLFCYQHSPGCRCSHTRVSELAPRPWLERRQTPDPSPAPFGCYGLPTAPLTNPPFLLPSAPRPGRRGGRRYARRRHGCPNRGRRAPGGRWRGDGSGPRGTSRWCPYPQAAWGGGVVRRPVLDWERGHAGRCSLGRLTGLATSS